MQKTLTDLRSAFLDFFARNGHTIVPSAPLVPKDDPTLMFVNAGMVPFKNIFTGNEKRDYVRATSSQKCVRAGGKHNDLDNVGYTARHHTFFEMLGNFSFGDYFKEQAIEYGWNFLTHDLGINPEKLCVTVYHDDDAAWNYWKKISGFPDHKIIRISTNDNFWAMGDTGPCGPCSEIFYDHGEHIPGGPPGSADADGDRFVEIWNLVFMQFEQVTPEQRINLPKPSIDTGMGLERMAAVMQGVSDNYDIDLFKTIIAHSQRESKNTDPSMRASHRVIADHLRSCSFLLADGVSPSNEGRGYVLRRIMRRGMRHAHMLGCREPLMHRLVPTLVQLMGAHYPELQRAQALIAETLYAEEERFKQTLERGLKLLEEESETLQKGGQLSGEVAFKLYDTFGFPLDLTQDILRARGIGVDVEAFERSMDRQRDMARDAWKGSGGEATGKIWFTVKEKVKPTEFTGYDVDESQARVVAMVKNGEEVQHADTGDDVFILLDKTPFYGEGGGQVGDTGWFKIGGDAVATIHNTTKPIEDYYIHQAKLIAPLKVGDKVMAVVDAKRRDATRANHSATHLLHKALREVLGEHVTQKGSLVAPDRLRFDISHGKAVTREELAAAEAKVNEMVWHDTPVECKVMAPDDAIKAGAMALFGEKYGEQVRVLTMGKDNYSTELCGGTHVRRTGDIAMFAIISEGSVAAGIRRIEAVTGEAVRTHFKESLAKQMEQLQKLREDHYKLIAELKTVGKVIAPAAAKEVAVEELDKATPKMLHSLYTKLSDAVQQQSQLLQEQNKKLNKELGEARKAAALGDVKVEKEMVGNIGFAAQVVKELPPKELRGLAETLLKIAEPGVAVAATDTEGKASLVVAVSKSLTEKISAVTLVQAAVEQLGGKGGGGKPDMAQGGGPDTAQLDEAVAKIKALL